MEETEKIIIWTKAGNKYEGYISKDNRKILESNRIIEFLCGFDYMRIKCDNIEAWAFDKDD